MIHSIVALPGRFPSLSPAAFGPSALNTIVSVLHFTIINDGNDYATVEVIVKDINNKPIINFVPTMIVTNTGGGNTLTAFGPSDINGRTTATVKSTYAETKTVIVTCGIPIAQQGTIICQVSSIANPNKSIISVSRSVVGRGETITITLTAKKGDNTNTGVGGDNVSFSGVSGLGTLGGTVTDVGDGTYTQIFTAITSGAAVSVTGILNSAAVTSPLPTIAVALFASDWSTGTGTSDASLRDTSKTVPWSTLYNANGHLSVVAQATDSLAFPSNMVNVLKVRKPAGTQSFANVTADALLPLPSTGQSLYFRIYLQNKVSDSEGDLTDPNSNHPVENCYVGSTGTDDMWGILFNTRSTGDYNCMLAFSNVNHADQGAWCPGAPTRQGSSKISKSKAYRLEWQLQRNGTNSWTVIDVRYYDDSVSTTVPIFSISGSGATGLYGQYGGDGLISTFGACTAAFVDTSMTSFHVGTNGNSWTLAQDEYFYWGGMMVRTDDWCGAY